MATVKPNLEVSIIDDERRKDFLDWFDKTDLKLDKEGIYYCDDPELRQRVWMLVEEVYEKVASYEIWLAQK
ncbi:hypothetical protein ACJ73_02872 [Blastomyces percursus]|uniref:Uncharacterized protein n=1 Tax=Blastomyces percursus TaxID=1658174 RepID=A0A1J9RCN7_9EURO|nr:hypothetical protein ACJ73_02872 [Blastomyces percursus]